MLDWVLFLTGGSVGAILVLAIVMSTRKRTPQPPCVHDWVPIDVRLIKGDALAFPQTVVLHRCGRCALHCHVTFPGDWAIEDFLKTRSGASEIAELRRMAE